MIAAQSVSSDVSSNGYRQNLIYRVIDAQWNFFSSKTSAVNRMSGENVKKRETAIDIFKQTRFP
jgi:hypothetical protein